MLQDKQIDQISENLIQTCAIGTPNVLRSNEYFAASSSARAANPVAIAATNGRVLSNVFIAILNPSPGAPITFC